jgi:hypothetical protein
LQALFQGHDRSRRSRGAEAVKGESRVAVHRIAV